MKQILMCRLFSTIMVFVMLIGLCTPAIASEQEEEKTELERQEYGVMDETDMQGPIEKDVSITMSMEDLVANSQIAVRSGTTVAGTYTSPEYDAGFLGYTYTISFDWVADIREGDYVFAANGISNAMYDININFWLLMIAYSYYSYEVTYWNYSISDDMKNVTFTLNYDALTAIHGSSIITSTPVENTLTVAFSDVR